MWRLADQETPGYFPVSDRSIPTEYCCIFGISRPSEKFPCSTQNVQGRDNSYLVLTGPDHRIYWFLFKKLPVTAYGKIPRYTKDQEDALVAEHASDHITDTLTFGELYALRKTSTLQALPEVVFSKWHYNRIMTIGDAAHKVSLVDSRKNHQTDTLVVQPYQRPWRKQRNRRCRSSRRPTPRSFQSQRRKHHRRRLRQGFPNNPKPPC